ncbi:MAG: TetR family transcriptional regulator [Microthrixaceae bacterium]|nr:TetR family transcriptional regulator [Microthrixaceae bacterium]
MTTTRRRLTPEARRDELLDAAADLALDADDATAATLERVAEKAGCSRNLAYKYFPNQAALLEALAWREGDAVRERLAGVPLDAPFTEWFEAVIDACLDLAEQRGRLLLMLFDQSMFPGGPRRRSIAAGLVAEKLMAAGLSSDVATATAPILTSAILGSAGAVVGGSDRSLVATQLRRVAAAIID